MKRRKFIEHGAKLGLVSTVISCQRPNLNESNTQSIFRPKKTRLGVALVGLGDYSTDQLAPALERTTHCYLAGIVTGSPEKIPSWQEKYEIPDQNIYNYDNMDQIAKNDEIDVVYIVVPPSLHAKYAIKAAEAGKHVWCEKPMAMNVDECQSIINACTKNGVRLSIGYRMMHEDNTMELISYKDTKPFGNITGITAKACYSAGKPRGWRGLKNMGGGALYDMGVYTVSGIRYASGIEPVKVLNAKHIIDRPKLFTEVDETTEYQLLLANGVVANGYTSVGSRINILQVDCESGWYNLSPMQAYYAVSGERSDGHKLDAIVRCQQCLQMDNDSLAIMNDTDLRCPGELGMRDIQIIEAIFKSAKLGSEVDVQI